MDLSKLIDPSYYPIVSAAAALALAILARRGVNIPILSALLTYLIGHPPIVPPPVDPKSPLLTPATGHPFLDAVLAAILTKLGGAQPVGFIVEPNASDPTKLTVTLHTAAK